MLTPIGKAAKIKQQSRALILRLTKANRNSLPDKSYVHKDFITYRINEPGAL